LQLIRNNGPCALAADGGTGFDRAMSNAACRLYLITPPSIDDAHAFARELEAALSGGDVAALQVRLKGADDAGVAAVTRAILPVAQARGVAVIMNDRPDLAASLGCDGVHVGQQDASYDEARRAVGRDGIVGVTCHDSRHLAMQAAEAGADYVAFGAFHDTATKDAPARADPEILSIWQESMTTPCVAIGGVTVENAAGLAAAGADFLAVCAGVWRHPAGTAAAVAALEAAIAEGLALRPSRGG
jgi:thiamine-phosphate pyrophosphorylase